MSMVPKIDHKTVNWKDGMKIRQNHFVQTENALLDHIRDARAGSIDPFNYGLLPSADHSSPLDLRVELSDTRKMVAQLFTCQAVTSGGARIDVRIESGEPLTATYDLSETDQSLFDVIIAVDPFVRTPTGEPDPEEVPVRHPYSEATYRLKVVPSDHLNIVELGAYHLSIAKVRVLGHEVKLSESYLPPCSRTQVYPPLRQFYEALTEHLIRTGGDARRVVQKIKVKGEGGALTANLQEWAERITYFLADTMDYYRMVVPHQAPVYLVLFYVRLARLLKTCLLCMSDSGKEEMLQYIQEWSDTHPGNLEAIINATVEIEYDHHQLYSALDTIYKFMETLSTLTAKLANLDYTEKSKSVPPPPPPPRQSVFVREAPAEKKKGTFWNI